MTDEIEFEKYATRGAYHWEQISRSIRRHNAFVSARYDEVLAALGDVRSQLLLDIGGGDGVLGYLLAQRGARVVTVDPLVLALRFARQEFERRGVEARGVGASAYALPFPAATFDALVCSDVIEHVQSPHRLLQEMARVLQSGGRFALTTPLRLTEEPLDPMHIHEFYVGQLQEMLSLLFDQVAVRTFAPVALLEMFTMPFAWLGGRPLFRYLFNMATVQLQRNPFAIQGHFRYFSMIIATGKKAS